MAGGPRSKGGEDEGDREGEVFPVSIALIIPASWGLACVRKRSLAIEELLDI